MLNFTIQPERRKTLYNINNLHGAINVHVRIKVNPPTLKT
ncbi:MAG: hypothetical protein FD170_1509 [Bacteroidetes bacterium]|nr:MAG: hypothetical protein FD170_1509 [Bacteroidota bacterium]